MALLDYQFEYTNGPNTMVIGKDTNIDVLRVQGLFNMEISDGDRPFTRTHGHLPGDHLLSPKEIFIDLEVIGDPALQAYWDEVYNIQQLFTTRQFPVSTDLLKFKVPGLPEQFLRARPFRRDFKRNALSELGAAPMGVVLKAADPRIYGPTLNSIGPLSGTFDVTNLGDANSYPIMTIVNGGTAKATNNTHGFIFEATTVSGTLIADMDAYIRGVPVYVLSVGGVNKYGGWTQPRFPMALGSGINSITLNTGTSIMLQWRDTWL